MRIKMPDDSSWPLPDVGPDETSLEWHLRYGDFERVRLQAASVVAAYKSLVFCTGDKRAMVVRELRKACEVRS